MRDYHPAADSCYCLKFRTASAEVTKYYDSVLAPCGVTVRQYSLLRYISEFGQCSVKELADRADLDRSTLSRSLKPLLHQGLVVDQKATGERRSTLELSEAGERTLGQGRRLSEEAQNSFMERLGRERLVQLDNVLDSVKELRP